MLGLLKIEEDRLVVEVNSNSRAKRIRELIEERLRDDAKYKTTLIESVNTEPGAVATAFNVRSLSCGTYYRTGSDRIQRVQSLMVRYYRTGSGSDRIQCMQPLMDTITEPGAVATAFNRRYSRTRPSHRRSNETIGR